MKKAKKPSATKKKATKPAAKKTAKPVAKTSARPVAARSSAGTYTPQPIQGIGWAPFRYPLS
jgi:hypothetical protein